MFTYYFIFSILSLLAFQEIYKPKAFNIYYFLFLSIGLSIFIGLRNEIGCDWVGYNKLYRITDCILNGNTDQCLLRDIDTIEAYLKLKEIGYGLLNLIVRKLGGNFYILNYICSLFFILPILYFCSKSKRPFLSILISYPYLITVIGLGTIRQSISIAFLMVCINELKNLRFYRFYFFNFISILFHYSSLIFIFLPLLIKGGESHRLNKIKKILVFLFFTLCFIFSFFKNNLFLNKLDGYLYHTEPISIISPLIIWIMIAVPSLILLLNYKFFKSDDAHKFWRNYSIIGLIMFVSLFFNRIIALRLLIYFLPIKIYVLSNLIQINKFQKSPKIIYLAMILLSFTILTIWLNFANHSYCYLPYKNLLLN